MPRRNVHSDSDSESDQPLTSKPSRPSDSAMEKALRDAVTRIYRIGKMEDLTVKRVRGTVETSLGLEEGFFKADSAWKGRSDGIIKDEVAVQDRVVQEGEGQEKRVEESPPKPESPKPTIPAKSAKRANVGDASNARKRRKTSSPESQGSVSDEESEGIQKPGKQSRTSSKNARKSSKDCVSDESGFENAMKEEKQYRSPSKNAQRKPSEDRISESHSDEVKKPAKKSKPKPGKPESNLSNEGVSDDSDAAKETKPSEEANDKEGSESELSVVLDEEPPKPSRKRQKSSEPPSGKSKKRGKAKDADVDPDQAEIKRLQGWLVKCGIRKMWARELAPYDTPKTKIKHLKGMLKDAGMEGRYSLDKAKRIREEREFKEDLEMVQEGAKKWGRGAEEESEGERPRRRMAQGRKSLAFLESDGEETD